MSSDSSPQDTVISPGAASARPAADRWEWRTFAPDPLLFGAAPVQPSSSASPPWTMETYLVARRSLFNAKIRDGMLDLKRLIAVTPDGLEQWHPVLRAAFPLSGAVCGMLRSAWHCDEPEQAGTVEDLLAAAARCPDLRLIRVRKWRRVFELEGCRADRVIGLAGGTAFESLGLEHDDPATLREALRRLGLRSSLNLGYPRWLRQLAGWPDLDPGRCVDHEADPRDAWPSYGLLAGH